MPKLFSFLIALGCCFHLFAQPSKIRHLVLIGCDGFGAYAVPDADMPELKKLMQNAIITYDTGATIAWLLGLNAPAGWRGLPVKEAFSHF